jgi:GMP synthase (glutamine-hydrolysing)
MAELPKPLLIIQTGHAPKEIQQRNGGDYPAWFCQQMGTSKDEIKIIVVSDGEALPDVDSIENSYSGIIITGSPAFVTDREEWSIRTGIVLKQLVNNGKIHVLGVCYGHQLLADSLGGLVGDNPNGSSFGSWKTTMNSQNIQMDSLFSIFTVSKEIYCHVSHRQVVLKLPRGAVNLGSNTVDSNHIVR